MKKYTTSLGKMSNKNNNNDTEMSKSTSNSYKYTTFDSVRKGFAERFIEAFASFLQATPFQFTLLVSLPQFIGGISQLFTTPLMKFFKSRKSSVIALTLFQAAIWIPIFLLAFITYSWRVWIYILLVTIYFVVTLLQNPLWNSWLMDLIPIENRGRYISFRSKILDIVTFLSFIAGGFILNQARITGSSLEWAFASLFIVAIVSTLIGIRYLSKIHEPKYTIFKPKTSLKNFILGMRSNSQGLVVLYLGLMSFSVAISAAYYTPYVLQSLQFSYMQFVILFSSPFVIRMLFAKRIGRIIDRYGPKKVLRIVSFFIVITPLLWLVNDLFVWLLFAQIYSGFAFGAYEIAALSFFVNGTNSNNRISLFSYYNFFNGFLLLLGALSSNLLVKVGPFDSFYLNAFFFSGIFRLLVLFIQFPRQVKEKDYYSPSSYTDLSKQILALDYTRELLSKLVTAKELISIRPVEDNSILTKLGSGGFVKIKKQYTIISYEPKKDKKEKIKVIEKPKYTHAIYSCLNCNSEFRRFIKSKTTLFCPYCSNKKVIFVRPDYVIKKYDSIRLGKKK
jgi:MFS family permease/DNA-directed RNA polymerase subunit RPC12/RpoP